MTFKAIVFDWDGVLADTLWILEAVYREMQPYFGVQELIQGKDWFECDWKKHWRGLLGSDQRLPEVQAKYLEIIKKYDPKTEVFPGTADLIHALAAKVPLAILTNNYRQAIVPILQRNGIHERFAFIYDAHEPHIKPDPHVITLTAQRLGITPAEMIFIGDMDAELEMAKEAGVGLVIGCAYGYHSEKRLAPVQPDHIVQSPKELKTVLLGAVHG
ncbi:MAG TPA: HAD family hydrolase [Candidatus Nanoarchaeia archaeon]|nr:HAD family hydrolase [Candidatus Nanoarchaeia archaeon]